MLKDINLVNKILITGGAGCLGSNLIEHLLPKNFDVFVIDNFATSKREVLPMGIKNLTVQEGSITDYALINNAFEKFKPDIIIHSAASYKDPNNLIEDVNTNITGAINLIEACKKYEIKKIINFQTALCYGRPQSLPIPISHKLSPFTSYGISKTTGESYLLNSSLPVISLRLANICAPRLSIGPIPTFYKRLKEGKDCFCTKTVRDFLDIRDFLDLIDIIIKNDISKGVFNVSTGLGHSIKDIFNEVAYHLKKKSKASEINPKDDDVNEVVLDPSETEKILGWKSKIKFKEIIKNQLVWYDNYGISNIYSHLKDK